MDSTSDLLNQDPQGQNQEICLFHRQSRQCLDTLKSENGCRQRLLNLLKKKSLPSDFILFNNNIQHPYCQITHYHVGTAFSYSTFEILNLFEHNLDLLIHISHVLPFFLKYFSTLLTSVASSHSLDPLTQHFNIFKQHSTPIFCLSFQPHILS